jgi:hypothetical protein
MDARSKKLSKDRSNEKNSALKNVEPFILKEGTMYKVGQDNRMHKCLTTLEAQILLKELHGVARRHFAIDITKKKLDARH